MHMGHVSASIGASASLVAAATLLSFEIFNASSLESASPPQTGPARTGAALDVSGRSLMLDFRRCDAPAVATEDVQPITLNERHWVNKEHA
jgi:hypothetical protein